MTKAIPFRTLYDEHVDFVWRNLRRLGVAEADVDDRTQEVFVVAHRRLGDFEDRGHGPRAWLYQIVLRIASESRRHRRRHPEDADGGAAEAVLRGTSDPAADMEARESLVRLDQALSQLDDEKRAVLVLHDVEEMTAPEIAEATGVPLNTVYSRLRLARQRLEEVLRRTKIVSGEYQVGTLRVLAGGAR
jgi:RNA polymerase sigma-70 factor (ECF subfamily)